MKCLSELFVFYQDIYEQLTLAAEAFLDGEGCQVDMAKRTIKLSQILKWYSVDFGKNKEEVGGQLQLPATSHVLQIMSVCLLVRGHRAVYLYHVQ